MQGVESIAWLLAIALVVVPLLRSLGMPSVIGYLISGLLIGPHLLNIIDQPEAMISLADFGIAMLLFVIGLELEPSRLWVLRHSVLTLGGLQVLLTGSLLALAGWLAGLGVETSLIVGMGLSLSSTAFALQLLSDKGQLATRHGRESFAILLFQDIAVIPLLAVMPLLVSASTASAHAITPPDPWHVLAVMLFLFFASRFLVRPAFRAIAASQTAELFTAAALFIVVGTAWLMHSIHLSVSLGAFLAGVLLADSEYRHELEAQIQPFKGLLLGLFFMTVGMTANLPLLLSEGHWLLLAALVLMLFKGVILFALGKATGNETLAAIRLGVALPQGGEFAFIVFTTATLLGLLPELLGERLVLVVTLSMALTPLGFWLLERYIAPHWAAKEPRHYDEITLDTHPEVLIAGFGRVGQIIARVLRMQHIPFVALESSARQVDFVRRLGNKIYYGRPDSLAMLTAAGIAQVKLVILAIDNIEESLQTARLIRRHYPRLPIYARARDRMHAYRLLDMGVNVVHRETYLSSLAMAEDVLLRLGHDKERSSRCIERFKSFDEELLRRQQAIYQDEAELNASIKQAMIELEDLFERDRELARDLAEEHRQDQAEERVRPPPAP